MSKINEIIAETQFEERQREVFLDHLINRLILIIDFQQQCNTLTEVERNAIIDACNATDKYKSKYAIELLELLNK